MGDGTRYHQQQSRSRRKSGRQSPGCHQCNNPGGELSHFGGRKHHDIPIDFNLVGGVVGSQLIAPVPIFILKAEQSGITPLRRPIELLHLLNGSIVQALDEVIAGESGDCRGAGIEDSDEQQRPTRRKSSISGTGNRIKPDDDVGESCRTHH